MPSPNVIKAYAAEYYYHAYNRGVEKREIFLEHQDYMYFLKLLHRYLHKPKKSAFKPSTNDLHSRLKLVSYCLMPNHFHLLLYQEDEKAIEDLMQRVLTGYVMYFNHKYDRVGPLFQSRYKARPIESTNDLINVSKYIHRNPENIVGGLERYNYSSFKLFVNQNADFDWVDISPVLDLFTNPLDYRAYVEN